MANPIYHPLQFIYRNGEQCAIGETQKQVTKCLKICESAGFISMCWTTKLRGDPTRDIMSFSEWAAQIFDEIESASTKCKLSCQFQLYGGEYSQFK